VTRSRSFPSQIRLLLVVLAVSTGALPAAEQPSLEEIVAAHLQATFGEQDLSKLQVVRLRGVFSFRGLDHELQITARRPASCRLEVVENGTTVVRVHHDGASWQLDRDGQPGTITDPREQRAVETLTGLFWSLAEHAAQQASLKLAGTEEVEGAPAYRLLMSHPDGKVESWFIDCRSHLLVKRSSIVMRRGEETEQAFYFLDYRQEHGLMVPGYLERTDAHYVRGYELSTVELDPELTPGLFAAPAGDSQTSDPK
jgi:hypothetical protein